MLNSNEILELAFALIKDNEYKKANKIIIDKINEVLEAEVSKNRAIVKVLNKEIFMLNRTIEKYKVYLEKIKNEVNDEASLRQLEQCLQEINNKRTQIIDNKRKIL